MADWDAPGGDDWDADAPAGGGGGDWDAPASGGAGALDDKWDGEDENEDALLGDDWDAEPKTEEASTVIPGEKKLTKRQMLKAKEDEERLLAEKRAAARSAARLDPEAAEKERAAIKRAIEASNQQLTMDLFGGEGYEAPENGEFVNEQLDQDNIDMASEVELKDLEKLKIKPPTALEEEVLKTVEDYKKFGAKVSGLVTKGNQKMLLAFISSVLTESTKGMKLDDCSVIKKQVNVICNQKQKDELNKKKKGGTKKATINSRRDNDYGGDDDYADGMDDYM